MYWPDGGASQGSIGRLAKDTNRSKILFRKDSKHSHHSEHDVSIRDDGTHSKYHLFANGCYVRVDDPELITFGQQIGLMDIEQDVEMSGTLWVNFQLPEDS